MEKEFSHVLKDIEKLTGKKLKGISGRAKVFSISKVDYTKNEVLLNINNTPWKFDKLQLVWEEMCNRPAAHVETVLGGSGSSRNQVETIYANLPYVEYLYINSKKHIAYVGAETHACGEIKKMDSEKTAKCQKLMKDPASKNPFLNRDESTNGISVPKSKEKRAVGPSNKYSLFTGYQSKFERNRILFGAPGTGKSFNLRKEAYELINDCDDNYERITFHPDYSYANFVGTYKPVPYKDNEGKDAITYEFVPGPFMRVWINSLKRGNERTIKPCLLIIEEINRANMAAVFGDVFQLLDRDDENVSEFPIQASEDIKNYLARELGGIPDDYKKIWLPDNMFIWATMNSADQGVFPMDTAFKRRWNFEYYGIDDEDDEIQGKTVVLGSVKKHRVEWNRLRKAINHFLDKQKINEDKQLGPYFMAKKIIVPKSGNEIDPKKFSEAFKNKVIMYLFEDAAKQKRAALFEGCSEHCTRYSEICKKFDEIGIYIFNEDIQREASPESL